MSKKLPLVAIIGRPNVGKSSLFNRLVGQRKAIVTDIPGTTRDPVESVLKYRDKTFWLVDTAGMADDTQLADDVQAQVDEAIATADVVVVVADADEPVTDQDRRVAKQALKTKLPVILAVNKIDKTRRSVPTGFEKLGVKHTIGTSAIHGYGADELLGSITANLKKVKGGEKSADLTLALVGRPNVGKSSLFNKLTGADKALVSQEPGTTRDVNQADIKRTGKTVRLLDTGGIRRSGKIARNVIERFSLMRTTSAIANSDVCVLLIDGTEPSTALDQKIAGLVKEAGRGLILALNKWDLVRDDESQVTLAERLVERDFQFVWWAPLVYVSANSGHNANKLVGLASDIQQHRRQQIPTPQLNTLLTQAVTGHPPAGLKNRHPKLKYIVQTDTNPPAFTVFGSQVDYLHWSYKRYLETQLRETFDFAGTPIRLYFENKNRPNNVK